LWLAAQVFSLSPPNYPAPGNWFFNPFAWQLIFTIGFVIGVKLRRADTMRPSRILYGLAIAYLVACAVLVMGNHWGKFPRLPAWFWVSGFDKSWVGVFRLLHLLALVYAVAFSPIPKILSRWLDADNWIVRLGRNTLPVFWLSIVLSVIGHILRENLFHLPNEPSLTATSLAVDTMLFSIGAAILLALAFFLDWTQTGSKKRQAAAPDGLIAAAK
jgi:hypothetical protein